MKIGIFNETEEDIKEYLKEVKRVLKLGLKKLQIKDVEFNIIIVSNSYIKELNKNYRGIDKETDVISFALEDDKTFNPEDRVLGDIYIAIGKVYSQAQEYGHSVLRELAFLSVHGLLHLLGYDHILDSDREVMFALQEEILEAAGILR